MQGLNGVLNVRISYVLQRKRSVLLQTVHRSKFISFFQVLGRVLIPSFRLVTQPVYVCTWFYSSNVKTLGGENRIKI